ncbi:MAG: exodeoxyribonuclease III [Cytophagales bacterium]
MTKLISYNVNGIRASISKGLLEWLAGANPDIFCVQELKANEDQIPKDTFEKLGYHSYWHSAEKKGYSGVGIFTKKIPSNIETGCGFLKYDCEGRVLRADFEDFSVMNVYMPSGTSGTERQNYKYEWLDDFYEYATKIAKEYPNLIIVGDYNICHKALDIHNPVSNAKSSGFLPPERAWMDKLFSNGFVDSFREFNSEPHQYTWWSQRFPAIRERNLGWRIDYQVVTETMKHRLKRAMILSEAKHSDHCPTFLEFD